MSDISALALLCYLQKRRSSVCVLRTCEDLPSRRKFSCCIKHKKWAPIIHCSISGENSSLIIFDVRIVII